MSRWTIIILSLMSAVISGGVVGGLFLVFGLHGPAVRAIGPDPYGAGSGYRALLNFQCRYGQTKHILMNGVDDNFQANAPEPSRNSGRLSAYPGHFYNFPVRRQYDEPGQDKVLIDFFEMPPRISSGLFVTRIADPDRESNDYLALGDLSLPGHNGEFYNPNAFHNHIQTLSDVPGWSRTPDNVFSARLKDIRFKSNDPDRDYGAFREYSDLLSFLQKDDGPVTLEILFYDDTTADFSAMAVCSEPTQPAGLTFAPYKPTSDTSVDFQLLACNSVWTSPHCNPIYGDRLCSDALPLACFKDTRSSVPTMSADIPEDVRVFVANFWVGGEIDFTPPVRGDKFGTLSEANAYCAEQFGADWRVLDYHQGSLSAVAAPRSAHDPEDRVWIDIKDQPHGTCWARDAFPPADEALK